MPRDLVCLRELVKFQIPRPYQRFWFSCLGGSQESAFETRVLPVCMHVVSGHFEKQSTENLGVWDNSGNNLYLHPVSLCLLQSSKKSDHKQKTTFKGHPESLLIHAMQHRSKQASNILKGYTHESWTKRFPEGKGDAMLVLSCNSHISSFWTAANPWDIP